jgi:hypothetical protein
MVIPIFSPRVSSVQKEQIAKLAPCSLSSLASAESGSTGDGERVDSLGIAPPAPAGEVVLPTTSEDPEEAGADMVDLLRGIEFEIEEKEGESGRMR